uniref:SRPBCC family protein n=2 Tax=Algoriphagus sp. TaxID=1872435 RepID=UPI004047371B
MRLLLQTAVESAHLEVKGGFTEALFAKLAPPFPPVKVLRFDGCRAGDLVDLELNFIFFKQKWTSKITEDHLDAQEFRFVDEGIVLPFFLGKWRHCHRILARPSGSIISDEIDFEGVFFWLTPLLYPLLWLQFWYRKPIYRRIFRK